MLTSKLSNKWVERIAATYLDLKNQVHNCN